MADGTSFPLRTHKHRNVRRSLFSFAFARSARVNGISRTEESAKVIRIGKCARGSSIAPHGFCICALRLPLLPLIRLRRQFSAFALLFLLQHDELLHAALCNSNAIVLESWNVLFDPFLVSCDAKIHLQKCAILACEYVTMDTGCIC